MATERSEDEAWAAIVANYGERARLDDDPPPDAPPAVPAPPAEPETAHPPHVAPLVGTGRFADDGDAGPPRQDPEASEDPEDRFVPPPPAPAPPMPAAKRLAWLGVLGTPLALLVLLVFSIYVPPLVGYGLVAAFVGGFGYLVTTMQRGEDRDPWDDGAQI